METLQNGINQKVAVPPNSIYNIRMMNEIDKKKTFIPPVRSEDLGWIKDGEYVYEIDKISEQDHEGHCWLYAEGRTANSKHSGEWISYDEGNSWEDIDHNDWH